MASEMDSPTDDAEGTMRELAEDHKKVLDQVEKGKGDKAAKLLETHIRSNAHFQAAEDAD